MNLEVGEVYIADISNTSSTATAIVSIKDKSNSLNYVYCAILTILREKLTEHGKLLSVSDKAWMTISSMYKTNPKRQFTALINTIKPLKKHHIKKYLVNLL